MRESGDEGRTSRNWTSPSSPNALTHSRPISLDMYNCTMLMSAERNMDCFEVAILMALRFKAEW